MAEGSPEDVCRVLGARAAALQAGKVALPAVATAMTRRCHASASDAREATAQLLEEVSCTSTQHVSELRRSVAAAGKAQAGRGEAAKGTGEQLACLAAALEAALEAEDVQCVAPTAAAAHALLASEPPSSPFAWCALAASPVATVSPALLLCDDVGVSSMNASGDGLVTFLHCNCAELEAEERPNPISLSPPAWPLRPGDVAVRVEGGHVCDVSVGENGVAACYCVVRRHVPSVTVHVSVLGVPLPASPWIVPTASLDSVVLSLLPSSLSFPFLLALTRQWLPCSTFTLLYRGSRDGMNSAAFRSRCIGKGPTLTLLLANEKGTCCVFGGYVSASWCEEAGACASPQAFLFTVSCPGGHPCTQFPLKRGCEGEAMWCGPLNGPCFGKHGIRLTDVTAWHEDIQFSFGCNSTLGSSFTAPASMSGAQVVFTGREMFHPNNVEVFAVATQP